MSMTKYEEAAREGLAELDQLIEEGRVPNYVESFSKLHDYIDANELAGLCESRSDWSLDEARIVQGLMDARIQAVYQARKARGTMTEYRVDFTAFVSSADGTERFVRPGWLILECGEDEDVAAYAAWDSDALVDVDFIEPGDHFPSAANPDVLRGQGCRIEEGESFFFAVITKITRSAPAAIVIDKG